jgi:hypothetical protein
MDSTRVPVFIGKYSCVDAHGLIAVSEFGSAGPRILLDRVCDRQRKDTTFHELAALRSFSFRVRALFLLLPGLTMDMGG